MSPADVKNKMRTLSEGAFTDRVLTQMAGTFTTLVKFADFSTAPAPREASDSETVPSAERPEDGAPVRDAQSLVVSPPFGALAYNINIQLPESRDPAVYNVIFKALREHLR